MSKPDVSPTALARWPGLLIILSLLVVAVLFGIRWASPTASQPRLSLSLPASQATVTDHEFKTIRLGEHELRIEVVSTPASVAQGLSGRETLGSEGMLFIFPQADRYSFWMKEMRFDLDLIWLREHRVVEVTPQVPHPAPQTPLVELPRYIPRETVDMVLEVEAGKAAEWGVEVGDFLEM
jgi:uncharacterized membrane protein (UPF0127 family)